MNFCTCLFPKPLRNIGFLKFVYFVIFKRLPEWSPTGIPSHFSTTSFNNICLCSRELPCLPDRNTAGWVHYSGNLLSHLSLPSWHPLLSFADWKAMYPLWNEILLRDTWIKELFLNSSVVFNTDLLSLVQI